MGVLLLLGKHPETGLPSGAALAARSVQEARAGHAWRRTASCSGQKEFQEKRHTGPLLS